jgi:hypothetical protein
MLRFAEDLTIRITETACANEIALETGPRTAKENCEFFVLRWWKKAETTCDTRIYLNLGTRLGNRQTAHVFSVVRLKGVLLPSLLLTARGMTMSS